MSQSPFVLLGAILLAGASAGAAAHSSAFADLNLRVGPKLNASVRTANMHLSCSDDARCRIDVPTGSTFEVVARGPEGHRFQWTGCKSQPQADRCLVEVRGASVTITVR